MTLTSGGGEFDLPACGPPSSFSFYLASSALTPTGSVHKSRGNNVVNDLRKGDLFVLIWARVRRGSLSSELIMCGGGVRSILLLSLVTRCIETIYVCMWRMFVFMSVVVTVWGSAGMCCVAAVVKNSVFFALECCVFV